MRQKLERVLELPGQPVKRGTMAHEHIVYMMLAEAAAQARDESALRTYAPRLEELATRDNHRPYLAIAHRAWGVAHCLAGEDSHAQTRLNHALELFSELDLRWQMGRTLCEMAELDLAQSDSDSARDHLQRALTQFEAMHAAPDAARTRASLAALT